MPFGIALTGLNAALGRLRTTANNIANTSTPGFKQSRVNYVDAGPPSGGAGGVKVSSLTANPSQGPLQLTDNAMDLAISGNGFFRLNDNGATVYSRDGSFHLDRDGYMVNGNNQRLMAFGVDANGNVSGQLGDVRITSKSGTPIATTRVDLGINLAATATTPGAPFSVNDPTSYNFQTSTTVYDSQGSAHQLNLYYTKAAVPGGWEVRGFADGNAVLPASAIQFSSNGSLSAPASGSLAIPGFNPGNGAANLNITLNLTGVTQYGDASDISAVTQDGSASSPLVGVGISSSGIITTRFANGQSANVGQVALAGFNNPTGLQNLGNNTLAETHASGPAALGVAGSGNLGAVQGGALETSNVDLEGQLVSLIEAKQQFQANAKMIKTNDELIGTLLDEKA